MNIMTFEQFQATGHDCADIGQKLKDESLQGTEGRIYLSSLYIERWDDPRGPWLTTIENTQPHGTLEAVERELYRWAVSAG